MIQLKVTNRIWMWLPFLLLVMYPTLSKNYDIVIQNPLYMLAMFLCLFLGLGCTKEERTTEEEEVKKT